MKEDYVPGRIAHWGRVSKRYHLLTAVIREDFKLGDIIRVKVLRIPDCNEDCKRSNHAKSKTQETPR
jgi:exosome complex RNA-binding protein Csl4